MFTLHVRVPLGTPLGSCVSYLQHITALAVVYSVCKMDGYQVGTVQCLVIIYNL